MAGFYQNPNLGANGAGAISLAGSRLASPDCRVVDDATATCMTAEGVGHDQFWRVVSSFVPQTKGSFYIN